MEVNVNKYLKDHLLNLALLVSLVVGNLFFLKNNWGIRVGKLI